jgi:4-amino-4-deoxy-L-arabinose transferase-like glycosyltransferase
LKLFASLLVNESLVGGHGGLTVPVDRWWGARSASYFGYLAVGLLLIGAGLRISQYAIGAALWHDELALARNIVEKPIRELLTTPLDYTQVAPPGFLLLEKAAVTSFGNNEYALRLFPLIGALISLPLFAAVARRTLLPGAALLAIALFSLSPTLIGFGSQVKQYAMDVAIVLLMTALTLRWWERRDADENIAGWLLLGAAGFIAVWFSHAAVLVVAGLGVILLFKAAYRRDRVALQKLTPIVILWGLGTVGAVVWAFQTTSPSVRAYMQEYWAGGGHFMPLLPRSSEDVLWLWLEFFNFFRNQLRYPIPALWLLLMLVGVLGLTRRHRWHALVVLAPIGVNLLAAAARQYPFGERVSLFLLPFVLLLVAEGVDWVRQAVVARWRPLGATVLAIAAVVPAYALYAYYPVYSEQPMPEVLVYVQARLQPKDAVYVHHGAWHAVGYYGSRYGLPLQAVVPGSCGDPRRLLSDLDQFRGRARVWVIISHVVGPLKPRETILGYLDTIGIRRDSIVTLDRARRPSSSAYLYDLSDPLRLGAVSAETYTVPPRGEGRDYPCVAEITDQRLDTPEDKSLRLD